MNIYCKGWSRNMGRHWLCHLNLSEGRDRASINWGEFTVKRNGSGPGPASVEVWWDKQELQLGGHYFFAASFSPRDIARLFVEAFADAAAGDVLSMLTEAQAAKNAG